MIDKLVELALANAGRLLTPKEIKELFGYSPKAKISKTRLYGLQLVAQQIGTHHLWKIADEQEILRVIVGQESRGEKRMEVKRKGLVLGNNPFNEILLGNTITNTPHFFYLS